MRGHAASGSRKFNRHWQSAGKLKVQIKLKFLEFTRIPYLTGYRGNLRMHYNLPANYDKTMTVSKIRIYSKNMPAFTNGGISIGRGNYTSDTTRALQLLTKAQYLSPSYSPPVYAVALGYNDLTSSSRATKFRLRKYLSSTDPGPSTNFVTILSDPSVIDSNPGDTIHSVQIGTAQPYMCWQPNNDFDLTYNISNPESIRIFAPMSYGLSYTVIFDTLNDFNTFDNLDKSNFEITMEFE